MGTLQVKTPSACVFTGPVPHSAVAPASETQPEVLLKTDYSAWRLPGALIRLPVVHLVPE